MTIINAARLQAGDRVSEAATSISELEKELLLERERRKDAERLLAERSQKLADANEDLVRSHEAARQNLERSNLMISHLPGALIVTRLDGTVIRLNPPAWRMFGLKTQAVREALTIYQLIAGLEGEPDVVAAANRPRALGSALYGRNSCDSRFPAWVSAQHVSGGDGDQILWLVQDATATAELETKRLNLENELRHVQKLESLGTLAGGIAHELNTPIQFITDNVRFLSEAIASYNSAVESLSAHVHEDEVAKVSESVDLDYMKQESAAAVAQSLEGLGRVSEIVLAVRRFSHPTTAGRSCNNLNEIIRTAVTVSRGQWKYAAEMKLDLAENLPDIVCNAGELSQIALNLIVNAAHAIEDKKSGIGSITLATRLAEGVFKLSVTDNGVGMTPDVRDHIFDLFFTTKAPGRGTGQGLSLVHTIVVNNHKGKIDVQSEPGVGTTFTISLPMDLHAE